MEGCGRREEEMDGGSDRCRREGKEEERDGGRERGREGRMERVRE